MPGLQSLQPKETGNRTKNCLAGISTDEQKEWDFEYIHQKTRERRWFHIVAMGSEVNGKKKYILVMSSPGFLTFHKPDSNPFHPA